MAEKILVAYASKYGATAQIAEVIALRLARSGFDAEARDVKEVTSLSGYKAVILGSGVYAGMWLKEAAGFLKAHEAELAKMPVWFFSDGPTGAGNPEELMKGWRFPEDLKPVAERIKPRDTAVFGGNVNAAKMSFLEKWVIKNVKSPVGDFRDWDMISKWAKGVAEALKA